MYAHSVSNEKY